VAMDWTDFDADGQATIMLSLLTRHGRATPLLWLTVDASTLKNRRNEYEYQVLVRLTDALPADIKVCIVADRGFGDQKLYLVLTEELTCDRARPRFRCGRPRGNCSCIAGAMGSRGTPWRWRSLPSSCRATGRGGSVSVHACQDKRRRLARRRSETRPCGKSRSPLRLHVVAFRENCQREFGSQGQRAVDNCIRWSEVPPTSR
jgi:hypothetical protein